jgi:hypothetical protein
MLSLTVAESPAVLRQNFVRRASSSSVGPRPGDTYSLTNHVRDLVSIDFLTVPTAARLRVLFVLTVLALADPAHGALGQRSGLGDAQVDAFGGIARIFAPILQCSDR